MWQKIRSMVALITVLMPTLLLGFGCSLPCGAEQTSQCCGANDHGAVVMPAMASAAAMDDLRCEHKAHANPGEQGCAARMAAGSVCGAFGSRNDGSLTAASVTPSPSLDDVVRLTVSVVAPGPQDVQAFRWIQRHASAHRPWTIAARIKNLRV